MTPTITPNQEYVRLDELDLREAILGDHFVVQRPSGRRMIVHAVDTGRAYRIGEFDRVADVWAWIDHIDEAARDAEPQWAAKLAA